VGGLSLPGLRTERLALEPVRDEHQALLLQLNRDSAVMRYIAGRAATDEETADEWARRMGPRSDAEAGLGYWVGFHGTPTGPEFVGWWGLGLTPGDSRAANLGYRLARRAWGQGLATEGSRAMVAHAFDELRVDLVWATTLAANTGSRGVLTKLGMRHTSTDPAPWARGIPGWRKGEVRYEITPAEWAG
jgi:RimJ/RimL family protein N-acetyltransferase